MVVRIEEGARGAQDGPDRKMRQSVARQDRGTSDVKTREGLKDVRSIRTEGGGANVSGDRANNTTRKHLQINTG